MQQVSSNKWYHKPLGIVLLLIVFFPIGLYLMWRYADWTTKTKGIITVIAVGLFGLTLLLPNPTPPPTISTPIEAPKEVTVASTSSPTPLVPTPTPTPAEKRNIVVTSQIVKKVDGKYRYFFDIRNNDSKDFTGEVTIQLFNTNNQRLGEKTLTTTHPISPKLGGSVNFDIRTGPEHVVGELGIRQFKYSVKADGNVVNTGEGAISEKFENTDF